MVKKTKTTFRILLLFLVFTALILAFGEIYFSSAAEKSLYSTSRTTSFGSSSYEPMEEIPGFGRPSSFYDYAISIYKFGIGAVGICAMLMIMIGGYMYMASAGNNASMEKAKGVITDAIVGLILALSSYLILYVINPDLTKIKEIKPIDTIAQDAATGVTGTTGAKTGSGKCQPVTSGACTIENLKSYFGDNATKASGICYEESKGNPIAEGDKCKRDGKNFSIGLFQINLIANGGLIGCDPKKIFNTYGKGRQGTNLGGGKYDCEVNPGAISLYEECVKKLKNPTTNIELAKKLSKNGNNWGPWSTNETCKF